MNAIVYVPPARACVPPAEACGTGRFVVDAADQNNLEVARSELHNLLKKQDGKENPLAGIPLLVRRATDSNPRYRGLPPE